MNLPAHARWFAEARYGLFLHWGAYAPWGRGEQVLAREMLPQEDYLKAACAWNPRHFDAGAWAKAAVRGGFRYAVLQARIHDGFCLFDTAHSDFNSVRQAMGRDVVREYVEAFREAGLRVGLSFSWASFAHPACLRGPRRDPEGWAAYLAMVHAQVMELLSNYGPMDLFRFDAAWPWTPEDWQAPALLLRMREAQAHLLIGGELGRWDEAPDVAPLDTNEGPKGLDGQDLRDFASVEPGRIGGDGGELPCENFLPSQRLHLGHAAGETVLSSAELLDRLCECSSRGANLLLGAGPDGEGRLSKAFLEASEEVGAWLSRHGEAIYATFGVRVGETHGFGRQTRRADAVFLLVRFWPDGGWLRLAGMANRVRKAVLLGENRSLEVLSDAWGLTLRGLPKKNPEKLFSVIRLELYGEPKALPTWSSGLWSGDPSRLLPWAEAQGPFDWVGKAKAPDGPKDSPASPSAPA